MNAYTTTWSALRPDLYMLLTFALIVATVALTVVLIIVLAAAL